MKGELFSSLHCKGLLVHMYFLDEKCVLIFKTDNNKMLYLKIVWCVFSVFFSFSVLFCFIHVEYTSEKNQTFHCAVNRLF